ncbi:hypothetical protein WN944_020144 [Citrus x changshan-huyou]|uniref:Uncharacterized protein n=1 Tax=Citrus x changshan-huyou TaxID=2935761 RepID=A0AAP0M1C3_9ROSI
MDIMKNEVDHFENKLTTLTLKFNSQDRMNEKTEKLIGLLGLCSIKKIAYELAHGMPHGFQIFYRQTKMLWKNL